MKLFVDVQNKFELNFLGVVSLFTSGTRVRFVPKRGLWGYSLEPHRTGGSNAYSKLMF